MRAVWYHANCWDGFGAAYAVWRRYGTNETTYQGVWHNQPPPELPAGTDELLLLDFTYPAETMKELAERVDRFIVIDHHVTAEADLADIECTTKVFDINHSGCYLTYRYLWPDVATEAVPLLFDYLEDRDLWRWELPKSREVNGFIKSYPYSFMVWSSIETAIELDFDGVVREGAAVLRLQDRTVDMICNQAYMHEIAGYTVPCVNATAFWSEVGAEMLKRFPEAQFVVSYYDRADGTRYYSLRSRDRFDCGALAKQLGGGGHHKAAAFQRCVGRCAVEAA